MGKNQIVLYGGPFNGMLFTMTKKRVGHTMLMTCGRFRGRYCYESGRWEAHAGA